MSEQDKTVCERILRLSKLNGVDPLPVVALLSLHALADMDFNLLHLWVRVADTIKTILESSDRAFA